MTGANNMNRPQLAKRKAIRLNGKTGKFIVTHLDKDKVRGDDGVERYAQEELTEPQSVVFLKVRRRLMQGSQKDGIIKYTTEHDTLNDLVTLFVKDGDKEVGPADVLREKHPELKTEQIIYVRWNGQVAKLSVKGLSLRGSDDTISFYQYISGRNDWYTHKTILTPTQDTESGYWFLNFTVGEKLTDEQVEKVLSDIKEVYDDCEKVKKDDESKVSTPRPVAEEAGSDGPPVAYDYPDDEIGPEDIPF